MSKINKTNINIGLKMLTILAFAFIFVPFNIAMAEGGYNTTYSTYSYPINYPVAQENNPKPTIDSINPKSSNLGVGTKTITITGDGFVPSSVARINAANRPTTFIDSSHLLVQVNGNDMYAYRTNGGFYITVYNGLPGGGYSNSAFFAVNNTATSGGTNTNYTNNNSSTSTTNFNDTNSNQNSNPNSNTSAGTTDGNNGSTNNPDSGNALASNAVFGSDSFLPTGLIQWILFAIFILIIVIIARRIFGTREKYLSTPLKQE
jgi:hypothetical protein